MITTVAGGSYPGNGGDAGAATSAQLNNPYGIALDKFENVYIADYGNSKVRMVSRAGIITTFAGTGGYGNNGDNGAAASAQLYQPQGVAVDIASGAVYIADTGNGRIRVVTSNGIITTFAGSNSYNSNNYYNCLATNSQLVSPGAVAVDHLGNVYIGTGSPNGYSSSGNQVLFVAHGTGYIKLLAGCDYCYNSLNGGSMSATNVKLNPVTGIAVDANLNLYMATITSNPPNNQVLFFTHGAGMLSVFAGVGGYVYVPTNGDGGPATSAKLHYPIGVGVDVSGNVYIADQQNNNVRRVANGTGIITTYAGGGGSYSALGDGGPATNAYLNSPYGIAVDHEGNVFIADSYDYRIRKVTNVNNIPTFQPTLQPSNPSSQPSAQPTGKPSIWHPKHLVSSLY